ncbi:MAG TPA: DUF5908 family protein [Cytophagaceae bacterium]
MAIEIKELIVKMVVKENTSRSRTAATELNASSRKKLIDECVEKVLQKVNSKLER